MVIDTGSLTSFVSCSKCERCGKHTNPPYNPDASSTSALVKCGSYTCAISPNKFACMDGMCHFWESYKEGSTTEGELYKDLVLFPGSHVAAAYVTVGCSEKETGEIFKQAADGIAGMGNNVRSLPGQLAGAGVIPYIFGLCLGYPSGGALMLGDAPLPTGVKPPSWTPMIPNKNGYYNVELLGIDYADSAAGGVWRDLMASPAAFAAGYGTVIDSGANFNHFPTQALNVVARYLDNALSAKGKEVWKGGVFDDHCWSMESEGPDVNARWVVANRLFPTLRMRFGGGTVLELPPNRYLFALDNADWCLGIFDNGKDGAIIGSISVRDTLVVYDQERSRIGFSDANCDELAPESDLGVAFTASGSSLVTTLSGLSGGAAPANVFDTRPANAANAARYPAAPTGTGAAQLQKRAAPDGARPQLVGATKAAPAAKKGAAAADRPVGVRYPGRRR